MAPSSNVVFEKELISHQNNKILQLKPFSMHLQTHTFCATKVFFRSLLNDQLSLNIHRFVILCICWDTTSILAFDNYQKCPLNLKQNVAVIRLYRVRIQMSLVLGYWARYSIHSVPRQSFFVYLVVHSYTRVLPMRLSTRQ